MSTTLVIEVVNGRGHVRAPDRVPELMSDIAAAINDDEPAIVANSSGPCEEACIENGGVEVCRPTFVLCNDGTAWAIDP